MKPKPVIDIPPNLGMPMLVGFGVIAGVSIGSWAVGHLFVEGTTPHERKNVLLYCATALGLWGAAQLFKLDDAWWLTPEAAMAKIGAKP